MRRGTETQGTNWRCPRLFPVRRNTALLVLKEEEKRKGFWAQVSQGSHFPPGLG